MKKLFFLLLACAPAYAQDQIEFVAPTEYVSGEPIAEFDKPLHYRVHFGFDGLSENGVVIEHGSPITFDEIGIDFGESVLGVTVLTQSGKESVMSNTITVQVGGVPKTVTGLRPSSSDSSTD